MTYVDVRKFDRKTHLKEALFEIMSTDGVVLPVEKCISRMALASYRKDFEHAGTTYTDFAFNI